MQNISTLLEKAKKDLVKAQLEVKRVEAVKDIESFLNTIQQNQEEYTAKLIELDILSGMIKIPIESLIDLKRILRGLQNFLMEKYVDTEKVTSKLDSDLLHTVDLGFVKTMKLTGSYY